MQLLAKRMDITALESVISDTYDYLNKKPFTESIVQTPCKPDINLTNYGLHFCWSQRQRMPWVPCDICEQGNCIKASTSSGTQDVVTSFADTVSLDFKISHEPDVDGYTVLMGATCEATNLLKLFPMQRRSKVKTTMRLLKTKLHDLGGKFRHIKTDNDSVLTCHSFKEFLLEDPLQLLTMPLCPPHHHECNGRQEARWRMLKSIATKAIAQLSLVIGDEASKYWSHAYLWAMQVMNQRKYKRAKLDFY